MAPKTRKKGSKPSSADPSHQKSPQSQQQAADLPSMFPAYDGSYGINTLLDSDAKGQKTKSGITNEKSDDQKWTRYMQGGRGKKYSMDSDLKNAINTGNQEVERDHQGSGISDPTDSGPHHPDSPSTNTTHPVSPTNPDYVAPPQAYVPHYDPRKIPFIEDFDHQPKVPYTRAQLPSLNQNAVIGVSQPKAPPYERIPFYGLPQGQGAKEPFSPMRPDTSRSFNFERGLFSNATVETPAHHQPQPAKEPNKPQQADKPRAMPLNIDQANQAKLKEYAEAKRKPAQEKEHLEHVEDSPLVHTHQHTVDRQFSRPQPDPRASNTATAMKRPEPRFDSPKKKKEEDNKDKNGLWGKVAHMVFTIIAALILVYLLKLFGPDVEIFPGGLSWSNMKEGVPSLDSGLFSPKPSQGAQSPSNVDYDKLAKELRKDLPDHIWVQKDKRGRLKIPEDFWHALRDLIKDDDMILVLENAKDQPPEISNDHWVAVKSRIEKSGLLSSSKDGHGAANASIKDASVSHQSWETWLEHNAKSLKTSLKGAFISRDDFVKLFDTEASSYQKEITKKLAKQQDRITDIAKKIASIVDGPGGPGGGGMSKSEVKHLVDNIVTKAINKVKLGAIADGRNEGHESDLLLNQVNFFSYGAGARIDPGYTSSAWEGHKAFWNGKKWIERTYKRQPPLSALSTWAEEGECFCAGPDRKGFGQGTNNISVLLGRDIIPQNLVVEHILPGATLDPGAMPKEIELWAYIEEVTLRNEVKTFSETQFPNTPKEQVLDDGWVKIGHFNYESDAQGKGVRGNRRTEVFPLKSDLTTMNAVTNQLVIRALNNHGADHTCFYRLGLFGEIVERPEDYTWDQVPQKSGWFW
ncbi:hypothetical protein GGR57DRAFT_194208 [Xylariaceae sp. FL1272]|nr:hypothetical protein GGR57DRAFT_194208 [Xylariaceae sp. FL1272]